MAWFDKDILDFFAELELNNNREWFEQNKKRYERSVKKPMEAFAAEMIGRMQALDPAISMTPKDAVFRIYRDIRFSKDKAPYKTNAGMSITSGSKRQFGTPGVYFHVDARSIGIASGYYMLEPDQISAIRSHIAANLAEFERLLTERRFKQAFGTIAGEKSKLLPQELKAAGAAQPLLFNKQFYYWAEFDGLEVMRDDLPEVIINHFKIAQPMNAFLSASFGAVTP